MAKSTTSKKPRTDFPLFKHQSGRWCKKVRGKFCYFGKIADDEKGEAALEKWLDQKDELLAGRTPRVTGDGLTMRDLCNQFRSHKEQQVQCGEITHRTYKDYVGATDRLIAFFGRTRLVVDLAADDFAALRADTAKTYGPVALGNQIQRFRTIFKFAIDNGLIDRPIRYGSSFNKPSKRVLRKARAEKGLRMFEAEEIRWMLDGKTVAEDDGTQEKIDGASVQLRAMILLAINGGLGNADVASLPLSAVNLESGWLDYPRVKTGIDRRVPLWRETVAAIRGAIAKRPEPRDDKDQGLVFITKHKMAWAKGGLDNPVAKETRKLLDELGIHRPGLGFYSLRHSFRTVADATRDFPAVNHIMGHADDTMGAVYRERIEDARLRAVVNHVYRWLFGAAEK
jgi:integrase